MLGFNVNDQDKNLSLALGSTTIGQKLSTLTSAYSTFRNGTYKKESCLSEVLDSNNQTLYKNLENEKQIFRNDTANLMKIALKNVVNNGTAKKLKFLPFEVCSKTGTVGNEKGNTDAYNISFNDDYTIGVWYGNVEDSLMPNNVLGGTYPTEIANELWKEIKFPVIWLWQAAF
jgi:membrane peptidoglycan carboxypeptidase